MTLETKAGHPYATLTPDVVLDALDAAGIETDGRLLALNSYENRVYQVGVAEGGFVVAKFYRPGRWSDAAIAEEHAFLRELADAEIPAVAPLPLADGSTLAHSGPFRVAVFPRRGGRSPELEDSSVLTWLGRFIGRIHAQGQAGSFQARHALDCHTFGEQPAAFLLQGDWLPLESRQAYARVLEEVLAGVRACFEAAGPLRQFRLHGDCHPGNVLWTEHGPHFVDFDDACSGPAIQDLWMLLSGERADMNRQLGDLLEGYEDFAEFNPRELRIVEALRSLRMIHYAAWLARRWDDPAFPQAFPWFNSRAWWDEQIVALRDQVQRMAQPWHY